MSLFEYISIATSLLLSFSLARTLTNFGSIFEPNCRDWLHIAWVLLLLFHHVNLFWQLWLFQDLEVWTLFRFVLLLVGPVMLHIGATLLVPAGEVTDYRIYFDSIRRPFYSVVFVMLVQYNPLLYLLLDVPFNHPASLGTLILASAFIVGIVGRKRSIDVGLLCLFVLSVIGGLFVTNDHEVARALLDSLRD